MSRELIESGIIYSGYRVWGGIKMQTQHFEKSTSAARKAGGQIAGLGSFLATRSMAAQVFCLLRGFKKDVFLLGLNRKEYSAFPNSPLPFIRRGLSRRRKIIFMLQFHKAAFSLETAVKSSRTGVGRRFLLWEEGADLGLRSCWLHSTLPCIHWAALSQSQFEHRGFPILEAQRMIRFAGFSLPFLLISTQTATGLQTLPFTLCGSNNPQPSEMPRISSRANMYSGWMCPAGSQARWPFPFPMQKFSILFFIWWNAVLNLPFIQRNTQPCSRPRHPRAWPKYHLLPFLPCWSIPGFHMETWMLEPPHESSALKTLYTAVHTSSPTIKPTKPLFILPFQLHPIMQRGEQFSIACWWGGRKEKGINYTTASSVLCWCVTGCEEDGKSFSWLASKNVCSHCIQLPFSRAEYFIFQYHGQHACSQIETVLPFTHPS